MYAPYYTKAQIDAMNEGLLEIIEDIEVDDTNSIKNSDFNFIIPLKLKFNQTTDVTTDGETGTDTDSVTTDFFEVNDSEPITIQGKEGIVQIAFYDEEQTYLNYSEGDGEIIPIEGAKYAKFNVSVSLITRTTDVLFTKIYQKGSPSAEVTKILNSPLIRLGYENDQNLYHRAINVIEDVYVFNTGVLGSGSANPATNYAVCLIELDENESDLSFLRNITSSTIGAFYKGDGTFISSSTGGYSSGTIEIPTDSKFFILNISNNPSNRDEDLDKVSVVYGNSVPDSTDTKKIKSINGIELFSQSTPPEPPVEEVVTIYPKLEYGAISSTGVISGTWYNKQYIRTTNYIKVKGNLSVTPVTSITCEVRVSFYDEDYIHTHTEAFAATNSTVFNLQSGDVYVRFTFRKSSGLENLPIFTLSLTGVFPNNWEKKNVRTSNGYFKLIVPVNCANPNASDGITNDVQDTPNILADYGLIALPTSYRNEGEPTRLIIYCHGAGVNYSDSVSAFPSTDLLPAYWLSEGYAVMDIEGNPFDNTNEHFYMPQALQSYISAYEWVIRHFNIKTDGILLGGRSMGGGMCFEILQSRIPVIAACPVVPVANTLLSWNYMSQARRTFTAEHIGINGVTWTTSNPMSETEWDALKDNFEKLVKYSPLWRGITNLPDKDTLFSYGRISSSTEYDADEASIYENLHFTVKAPVKIFSVEDDTTIPSKRNAELIYKMMVNAGQICELRMFEEGGHHFEIDNPDCLTTITNTRGVTLTGVPVVYIEMLQFWRRYENT